MQFAKKCLRVRHYYAQYCPIDKSDTIWYNILDKKTANLISVAVSDKSLAKINRMDRDYIRADIFKNLIINSVGLSYLLLNV